jgi:hypothetical protein
MAKDDRRNPDNQTGSSSQPQPAAASAPAASNVPDERYKMIMVNGVPTKRIDYIRKRWAEKVARGQIAKELSELSGKKVPYQIVFSATKGLAGGPDKAPVAAPIAQQQ